MKIQPALERALALQNNAIPARAPASEPQMASDTLTACEQEIVNLVAKGMSNHDIAQVLVISQSTVVVHVKHILSKLRYRSRRQVAVCFCTSDRKSVV